MAAYQDATPSLRGSTSTPPLLPFPSRLSSSYGHFSVSLAGACTIHKLVDALQRHLIILYMHDRSLGVAAASEREQQAWYGALLEVRAAAGEPESPAGEDGAGGG